MVKPWISRYMLIPLQMSWWVDNPLSTNLAVLLYKSIVSFCLLPYVIEFHYFLYCSCGNLLLLFFLCKIIHHYADSYKWHTFRWMLKKSLPSDCRPAKYRALSRQPVVETIKYLWSRETIFFNSREWKVSSCTPVIYDLQLGPCTVSLILCSFWQRMDF